MMSIILWELKNRRLFTFWWSVGVSGLIAMTVLAYKSISHDTKQLDATFSGLSSGSGGFFGGSDFFSPIGYLSSQVYFILLPILIIIMVIMLVSSLMNREENSGLAEYILARPISRAKLLVAKAVVCLVVLLIVWAVSYLVAVLTVRFSGINVASSALFLTHTIAFGFSASFGAIAFVLMAASQLTRKLANPIAIIIAFGGYIIASLAGLVHELKIPAKFMPYHYYDTVALLHGQLSKGIVIYLIGVVVIGVAVAWFGYSRRDIG